MNKRLAPRRKDDAQALAAHLDTGAGILVLMDVQTPEVDGFPTFSEQPKWKTRIGEPP